MLVDTGTGSAVWFKEDVAKNLQWNHDAKCLKSGQLEGMEIKPI